MYATIKKQTKSLFRHVYFFLLAGADRCKRRFLYVVAIHMVENGFINGKNQPVVIVNKARALAGVAAPDSQNLDLAKNRLQVWYNKNLHDTNPEP